MKGLSILAASVALLSTLVVAAPMVVKREELYSDNTQRLKLLEKKGNVDAENKRGEPDLYPHLDLSITGNRRDDVGAEDKREELDGPITDLYSAEVLESIGQRDNAQKE